MKCCAIFGITTFICSIVLPFLIKSTNSNVAVRYDINANNLSTTPNTYKKTYKKTYSYYKPTYTRSSYKPAYGGKYSTSDYNSGGY